MTAPIRELIARTSTVDAFGDSRASRVFRIDTRDQQAALNHPGLPPLLSPHPEQTTLLAQTYGASYPDSGGVCTDVTVEYRALQYGNYSPPPPRDAVDWNSWTYSIQTEEVEMPVFYRTNVDVNGAIRTTFVNNPSKLLEARPVRSVSITLTAFDFNAQEYLAGQQNKIHTIGGKQLRFICGDAFQRSATAWEITYSWIDDRGTPVMTLAPDFPTTVVPWYIARPPHGRLVVVPNADPFDGTVPLIRSVVPYAADPGGHLGLPGADRIF